KVFRASRWDRSLRGAEAPRHNSPADGRVAQASPVAQGFSPADGRMAQASPVAQGFSPADGRVAQASPVAQGFSPADAAACGVDDGQGDYLNCPLTREEYDRFYDALVSAESATVHDFDKERFFEGCLPIEVMAHRGRDTLRFGPMKPVGLVDPRTG